MKKCLLLSFVSLLFSTGLLAQLGFTAAPTQSMGSEWQVLVENYITKKHTEFLKYGFTGTIDYTFQLKAPEWQFSPAAHATQATFIADIHDFRIYSLGLQGNFNFIPFKAAQLREWPQVLLYFQFSPGIDFVKMQYNEINKENGVFVREEKSADRKLAVNGGVNFFLDLKLTDLLTVSPMVGIRYFPNLVWSGFTTAVSQGDFTNEYDRVNWRQVMYGLRIGLNLENR